MKFKLNLLAKLATSTCLGLLFLWTSGLSNTTSAAVTATLSVAPTSQNLTGVGKTGSFNLYADPKGNEITSAEFVINFNPGIIRVDNITVGPFFTSVTSSPFQLIKNIDNTNGRIHYAVAVPVGSGISASSPNVVATVSFTTVGSGTSPVSFVTNGLPFTQLVDVTAQNVLASVSNGSVQVSSGTQSTPTPTTGATSTPTTKPSSTPTSAATNTPTPTVSVNPARLIFTPTSQNLTGEGKTGSVGVFLDPKGNSVASAELVINFNPNIIRVDDIAPGPFFTSQGAPAEVIENIDNINGRIHYTISFPLASNYSSSTANAAAIISFTTIAGGTSSLTFTTSGTPFTILSDINSNVLPLETGSGSIFVTTSTDAKASLFFDPSNKSIAQGQTDNISIVVDPNTKNVASVELVVNFNPNFITVNDIQPGSFFTSAGLGSPLEVTKVINNLEGIIHYTVGFPLGSNHSSTAVDTVAVVNFTANTPGSTIMDFVVGGTLSTIVSDINSVNVLGLTLGTNISISSSNLTSTPTPTHPPITLPPTSTPIPLTSTPTIIPPTSTPTPTPPGSDAVLSFSPTSQTKNGINQTGSVAAFLSPNGEAVSTVEMVIDFDPNVITVDNIVPGAFFTSLTGSPLEIIKTIDNTNGRIHYTVGFPLGSGTSSTTANAVADISFTTKGSGTTPLIYITSGNVKTIVSDINATNVLGSVHPGSILVMGTSPSPTPGSGAQISFEPSEQVRGLNQSGTVAAKIDPSGNQVATTEIVITFDPNIIRVDNVLPGSFFTTAGAGNPIEIIKNVDNTSGRIHYAIGFPLGSNFSSTQIGNMAEIEFTTLAAGTSNLSYIVQGSPKTTISDINAINVLGQSLEGQIIVLDETQPTSSPTPTLQPTPTTSPQPTTPPSGEGQTFSAMEDTYVSSKYNRSNYGRLDIVRATDYDGNDRTALLKFHIGDIVINNAQLKLTIAAERAVDKKLYVASTDWDEYTVKYDDRPSVGEQIGTYTHLPEKLQVGDVIYIPLDASKLVRDQDGNIAIAIGNTGIQYGLFFYSKEQGNPAQLVINGGSPNITSLPTATSQPEPTVTTLPQQQGASLQFAPTAQIINGLQKQGKVYVYVNPNGKEVASMELFINFDNSVIKVDDISPASFFTNTNAGDPIEIVKNINNNNGTIHYALGFPLGSNYSSTSQDTAATISFTTLTQGTSPLTFSLESLRMTRVSDINAADVLTKVYPGSITVTGGVVTPTITTKPTATSTVSTSPSPTPDMPTNNCKVSRGNWQNIGFEGQSGSFVAEFDATPRSSLPSNIIRSYIGFSKESEGNYFTSMGPIVEFRPNGLILARNGNKYAALRRINYQPGETYHFKFLIDVPKHIYSVWVTAPGQGEVQIADRFAFRVEQKNVTSLGSLKFLARTTNRSMEICDLTITPVTDSGMDTPISGVPDENPPTQTPTPQATVTPIPTCLPGEDCPIVPTATITLRPSIPVRPSITPPPDFNCTPSRGDADGNGAADLNDFNIWLTFFGQTTTAGPSEGDFNCSLKVDGIDFVIWFLAYRKDIR